MRRCLRDILLVGGFVHVGGLLARGVAMLAGVYRALPRLH